MFSDPEFWTSVAFVLLVVLIGKKIWTAATAGLDTRSARIGDELDEAQRLREEAQHLLAEYQRKQRDAAKEVEAIVAHAREEAGRLRVHAAEALEAVVARREQQASDRIAHAEAEALAEVRGAAVDLAVAAAAKLLAETLDAKASDALVDEAIVGLPERLH